MNMKNAHTITVTGNGLKAWNMHCAECGKIVGMATRSINGGLYVKGEGAWGALVSLGTAASLIEAERIVTDNHTN